MSSGITFDDYAEAREYQKRLLEEGINSSLKFQHGAYIVTPKEKTRTKIEIVKKGELGEGVAGRHYTTPEGEHRIYLEPKTSTLIRLHELGHAELGHESVGGLRFGDRIERELDAEIHAYKAMGKEVDYRVGWNAVRAALSHTSIDPVSIINEVARRMERRGIRVSREDKQELLDLTHARTDDPMIEAVKAKWHEQL